MVNTGPIPGANYTSDTKNYPWHQPPEFTDISSALDKIVEKITQDQVVESLTSLAELEIPLYRIAAMIIMEGVSEGKWTIDLALLLIGPTTKIIEIICSNFGVKYITGLDEKPRDVPTGAFFRQGIERKMKNSNKVLSVVDLDQVKQDAEEQSEPANEQEEPLGFAAMSKAPEEGVM